MECINCSATLKPGMKFCPKCGAKVEETDQPKEMFPTQLCCKFCGNTLMDGNRFCIICGAPVPDDAGADCPVKTPEAECATLKCSQCGAPLEPGMRFCLACGHEVSEAQTQDRCYACGAPMEPGMRFCLVCGAETGLKEKKIPPPVEKNEKTPDKRNNANRMRIILLAALCCIIFGALILLGVVLFRHFSKQDLRKTELTQAEIVSNETESFQEQATEAAPSSADPAAEPSDPASTVAEPAATETEALTEGQDEPTEILSEPSQPTDAPVAAEPSVPDAGRASEDYTYYYYRRDASGTACTGNTSLDPWDCDSSKYLWPTDSMYITNEDLNQFSMEQIDYLRNEIYARHGYQFVKNMTMKSYFESRTWYTANPDFSSDSFNRFESENVNVIVQYQQAHTQP